MGRCLNDPGKTDDANLGLWSGHNFVNLKKGEESLGAFPYEEILGKWKAELNRLIAEQAS